MKSGHRRIPKHVAPDVIDSLFRQLRAAKISNTGLANELGISRTTLHLMFKHEIGMRRVYCIAIQAVIHKKLNHD